MGTMKLEDFTIVESLGTGALALVKLVKHNESGQVRTSCSSCRDGPTASTNRMDLQQHTGMDCHRI